MNHGFTLVRVVKPWLYKLINLPKTWLLPFYYNKNTADFHKGYPKYNIIFIFFLFWTLLVNVLNNTSKRTIGDWLPLHFLSEFKKVLRGFCREENFGNGIFSDN